MIKFGISLASTCLLLLAPTFTFSQQTHSYSESVNDKFRQLEEILPTPNDYRNASGAPGHKYWQQQVDYQISVSLDENNRRLTGIVNVTYANNSPDTLHYLWLQLDQNRFPQNSLQQLTTAFPGIDTASEKNEDYRQPTGTISLNALSDHQFREDHELGYWVNSVKNSGCIDLKYVIVDTNMRIDFLNPTPH